MTTSLVSSNTNSFVKSTNKQLENYSLVWLDESVNENPEIEDKLRSVIDQLEKFQAMKECQEYIEQKSRTDRIVLIVSGQFGKQFVPIIHKFRQIISIYIYCIDQTSHEQWSTQYTKIKGVITKLCDLLSQIKADHKIERKVEESLPICIFNFNNSEDSVIAAGNHQFVFKQTFIDLLLRLKYTETDKNELINRLKKQFKDNPIELNNISKFEQDYTSDTALEWYTKKTFFYKTLNAALRDENLHMIFLYRSYIYDIHCQLEENENKHILKVYRGQMITTDALAILKKSIGQFICINSFFSTSYLYKQACVFLRLSNILERVIFEIEIDPKKEHIKPFADISKHSVYTKEAEVLFMIGSVFQIKSINRSQDDNISTIKLILSNASEYDSKQIHKQRNSSREIDLRTLAQFLFIEGKVDLAKKYFIRSINETSIDDPICADLYDDLSRLASKTCDYETSFQYLHRSIQCRQQFNNSTIGKTSKLTKQLKWKPMGIMIPGKNENGIALSHPFGICITMRKTVYIADWGNDRIVRWKCNSTLGEIVVSGNGCGNHLDQLSNVTDLVVDEQKNSYIICDRGNRRVIRWFDQQETNQQVLLNNIACYGITMDKKGFIYVSDTEKNEVRRWKEGEEQRIIVAGGNGRGDDLNQFHFPAFIFVDDDYNIYVSDRENHRIMKWKRDANEGILVAGGNGYGNHLQQLCFPEGVVVDYLGHIYIADYGNNRVVRWCEGDKCGSIVIGNSGLERESYLLKHPCGLSLDIDNNLYVVNQVNNRIQKYEIDRDELNYIS
ncbi:hypothetical protein I4U23_001407 [Adineta vaga]|nr:hypothetical protein I4U23_001407 [Adineta vaga]